MCCTYNAVCKESVFLIIIYCEIILATHTVDVPSACTESSFLSDLWLLLVLLHHLWGSGLCWFSDLHLECQLTIYNQIVE